MGLRHIFGDKLIPKLLDFLRVHNRWDYPLSTLAEATQVSYRTLQIIVPQLVKYGALVETRTVGKAKMYQLNLSSEAMKKLDEFATMSDIEFIRNSGTKSAKAMRAYSIRAATG